MGINYRINIGWRKNKIAEGYNIRINNENSLECDEDVLSGYWKFNEI